MVKIEIKAKQKEEIRLKTAGTCKYRRVYLICIQSAIHIASKIHFKKYSIQMP